MTKAEMDRVIDLLECAADRCVGTKSTWQAMVDASDAMEGVNEDHLYCLALDAECTYGTVVVDTPESRIESLLKTAAALRKERER